jgi:hypothetical protein
LARHCNIEEYIALQTEFLLAYIDQLKLCPDFNAAQNGI